MMLKEMIVEKSRKHMELLYPMGAFAASSVLAFSSEDMAAAPLICAFSGALPPVSSTAFSIGGILTYLTMESAGKNAFMMIAFILVSIGKWFVREDDSPKNAAFITLISMAFGGLVCGFLIDRSPVQSLINMALAAVGAAAAFFIRTGADAVMGGQRRLYADKLTLTALGGSFMLFMTLLSGLSFSFVNAGAVMGCLVILCAARFFGSYGGVICAVITGAALLAGETELGTHTVFFGAAGLAAGFCRSSSRITLTAVFTAVDLAGLLAVGMDDMAFCIQADTVIGGMIFLMLPEKLIVTCGRFFTGTTGESRDFAGKEMEFAAGALCDIRENITGVMSALAEKKIPYSMKEDVCGQVCGRCRNKLDCWEKNYERTNRLFIRLEQKKLSDISTVSAGFECIKRREVLEGFERARREEAYSRILLARINENRKLLFSQMEASEEIVRSLAGRLNVNISAGMTAGLCRTLDKCGIAYSAAAAYYNNRGRLIAEIYLSEEERELPRGLCKTLSRELGVTLCSSAPFRCGRETRLRFNQQTKYSLSYVSRQMSAAENQPCGDKCGMFTDGLGKAYIYISDGMGSGSRAALDSEISSRLFIRLIRSGMGCSGAVKLINSIMLTKPSDESFATLDIAQIDLDTGDMTIYKSGAAATLIRYSDAVVMYSLASNPVGIIPDPMTGRKDCKLRGGDVVAMMSDGVPEAAYPYIKEQFGLDTEQEKLAENICGYSHKIMSGVMPDDVTVTLTRLVEN